MNKTLPRINFSDNSFLSFFEMTPDLVCIASKEGFFKKVNRSVYDKLGYSKEELFSRPISTFIHPADRERTKRERAALLRGNKMLNFQNRYICKNGDVIWLQWTSIYLSDRKLVFAIAKDVTERKIAELEIEEKYIRYKGLVDVYKNRLEKERNSIAVELHEELAQLASVIKMNLDSLAVEKTVLPEDVSDRIGHAKVVSGLLVDTIRRMAFNVSPQLLGELGLVETIKWLCREFSMLNRIPCFFDCNLTEEFLPSELQIEYFRICQEALANIALHAQANSVNMSLKSKGTEVHLQIADDGRGFDMNEIQLCSGLTLMRESAHGLNAEFGIQSIPGRGTEITLVLKKYNFNDSEEDVV